MVCSGQCDEHAAELDAHMYKGCTRVRVGGPIGTPHGSRQCHPNAQDNRRSTTPLAGSQRGAPAAISMRRAYHGVHISGY